MIRDIEAWRAWEDGYRRSRPIDIAANRRIAAALYREAQALGHFSQPRDPSCPEYKIRLARILNVRRTAGTDRPRT